MKAIDIVKPVCPNWHQHHQLRKWTASLPSHAWEDDDYVYLIVKPTPHPCTWYITREDMLGRYSFARAARNLQRAFAPTKRKRY